MALDIHVYMKDGEQFRELVILEPEKAAEIMESVATKATVVDVEGRLLSPPGSNPEIILVSPYPNKEYKVIYRHDIPLGWVYCPDCHRALHQNMVINTIHLEQKFKCQGCKSIVAFEFITDPIAWRKS